MLDPVPTKPDQTKPDSQAPAPKCQPLPEPPKPVPEVPKRDPCTWHCICPGTSDDDSPDCIADMIRDQNEIVAKAERAKAYVDELTGIQSKVISALVDYNDTRFGDLRKRWGEQHTAITELVRKVICAVHCWKCLLECRVCRQLVAIRVIEEKLNGPGDLVAGMGLPTVNSLYDRQFWSQRNVANMQARVDRIKKVLAAWEKPSDTLGDALDQNAKLIEDIAKIVATDPAKAVYDLFMTLIQRHWAIRPRDLPADAAYATFVTNYVKICECHKAEGTQTSKTSETTNTDAAQTIKQNPDPNCPPPTKCKCDEGTPDDCCGPDVGVLSLRERLIGPLPYIVKPESLPKIICCLTKERLTPASNLLAAAQAQLAEATTQIEQAIKDIADKTAAIPTGFAAGLPVPFDCDTYFTKDEKKEEKAPETKTTDPQAQVSRS